MNLTPFASNRPVQINNHFAKAPANSLNTAAQAKCYSDSSVQFQGDKDDLLSKAKEMAENAAKPYTKLAPKQKAVVNGAAAAGVATLVLFGPLSLIGLGGIGIAGFGYNAYRNWNKK
jgi:hypothetical protein